MMLLHRCNCPGPCFFWPRNWIHSSGPGGLYWDWDQTCELSQQPTLWSWLFPLWRCWSHLQADLTLHPALWLLQLHSLINIAYLTYCCFLLLQEHLIDNHEYACVSRNTLVLTCISLHNHNFGYTQVVIHWLQVIVLYIILCGIYNLPAIVLHLTG